MRAFFLLCLSVMTLGCDEHPKVFDIKVSAEEGRDVTAVFEGCGKGSRSGYLFCRVADGTSADFDIVLRFPKVDCKRQSCVEIQFVNLEGNLSAGVAIPKGQQDARINVSEVIGSDTVTVVEDGEYRAIVRVYYTDRQGREYIGRMSGAFRLWVYEPEYEPLLCNDPNTGWKRRVGSCEIEYSTGMRTAVCGECD